MQGVYWVTAAAAARCVMLLVSTSAAYDHSGAANAGVCGFGPAGPVGDAPSLDVNHGLGKVDEDLGPARDSGTGGPACPVGDVPGFDAKRSSQEGSDVNEMNSARWSQQNRVPAERGRAIRRKT